MNSRVYKSSMETTFTNYGRSYMCGAGAGSVDVPMEKLTNASYLRRINVIEEKLRATPQKRSLTLKN